MPESMAKVLTYHEVIGLIRWRHHVYMVYDHHAKKQYDIYAEIVNAGGSGAKIAEYGELKLKCSLAKGALLILAILNNMVINRCRKPADADILVPGDTIS